MGPRPVAEAAGKGTVAGKEVGDGNTANSGEREEEIIT